MEIFHSISDRFPVLSIAARSSGIGFHFAQGIAPFGKCDQLVCQFLCLKRRFFRCGKPFFHHFVFVGGRESCEEDVSENGGHETVKILCDTTSKRAKGFVFLIRISSSSASFSSVTSSVVPMAPNISLRESLIAAAVKRNHFPLSPISGMKTMASMASSVSPDLSGFSKSVLAFTGFRIIKRTGHIMIKRGAFFGPLSILLRALGGVPVDRKTPRGAVGQMVEVFNGRDEFLLAIVPEGTRRKIRTIKTAFWHIAGGAGVSIICWYMDRDTKTTRWLGEIVPGDDKMADLIRIRDLYEKAGYQFPLETSDLQQEKQ
jgi:hypothetical protein